LALSFFTSTGGVLVIDFQHETVSFQVVKSIFLETSITGVILSIAVNELLLREGSESVGVIGGVLTLNSGDSTERPARSALTLILDTGNSTVISPIPSGWSVLNIDQVVHAHDHGS